MCHSRPSGSLRSVSHKELIIRASFQKVSLPIQKQYGFLWVRCFTAINITLKRFNGFKNDRCNRAGLALLNVLGWCGNKIATPHKIKSCTKAPGVITEANALSEHLLSAVSIRVIHFKVEKYKL
jgi:hypothetical protein